MPRPNRLAAVMESGQVLGGAQRSERSAEGAERQAQENQVADAGAKGGVTESAYGHGGRECGGAGRHLEGVGDPDLG